MTTPAAGTGDGLRGALRSSGRVLRITLDALRLVHRAHKPTFWSGAVSQMVSALGNIGIVYAVKITIDLLLRTQTKSLSASDLVLPVTLLAVATAVTASASSLHSQQQRLLGEHVTRLVWRRLLDVTSRVELETYESPEFFDRVERLRSNTLQRPVAVANAVLGIIAGLVGTVGLVVVLAAIQPLLVVPLVLGAVPSLWLTRKASDAEFAFVAAFGEVWRKRQYLRELLATRDAAKEVRAFGSGEVLLRRHDDLTEEFVRGTTRQVRLRQLYAVGGVLVTAALLAGTLVLLVVMLENGTLSLAQAGAAVVAIRLLSGQLGTLFSAAGNIIESGVFLVEFDEFVASTPVPSAPAQPPLPLASGVRVEGLSYRYPGADRDALTGIDLEIPAGRVVALVGENGSGKTTLAKIVGGLYPPSDGVVRWDGAVIDEVDRARLRASSAVIFQDFVRYRMPVRENVALGDPDRLTTADPALDDDVIGALRQSNVDLAGFADGLDTVLSREFRGGTELSGGEWQRIALARALFRSAPLVVLDEPSAALDPRAEQELFSDVRRLVEGRAALFVSHRYGNLHLADRIYVMRDGRIAESGSHEELLAAGGVYAQLYRLQADAYAAGVAPRSSDG
jgi:ATP-binding cassette subfamily B protein